MRILVDRLWPRGVRRGTANVDIWLRDVGPSDELRKWFSHEREKWPIFEKRYQKELKVNDAFGELVDIARTNDPITLLYAASDIDHNNAKVLYRELIKSLANSMDGVG